MPERTYEIIVPANDNAGMPIRRDLIEDIAKDMAMQFGGVTMMPVSAGCWINDRDELMCDQNVILTSTRTDASPARLNDDQSFMVELARDVAVEFGQAAVYEQQEFDNRTVLVPGKEMRELPRNRIDPRLRPVDPSQLFERLIPG